MNLEPGVGADLEVHLSHLCVFSICGAVGLLAMVILAQLVFRIWKHRETRTVYRNGMSRSTVYSDE